MELIFINRAGKLCNDKYLYELQFSEDIDASFMQGEQECYWGNIPSSGKPLPLKNACKIFYFLSDKDIVLTKDSHVFSLEDAKEGIVAIAYSTENIYGSRLKLFYGNTYDEVKNSLYEKNINIIEKENIFA